MNRFSYFLSGLLFSAGLVVAGMTRPQKVIGFLDFFGNWDPSLAFVMGGAILVHFPAYLWMKRRTQPLWAGAFSVPSRRDIDFRLMGGAALFGIGWGLGGYCPGPGLVALTSLAPSAFVFVLSMIVGMIVYRTVDLALSTPERAHAAIGHRDLVMKPPEEAVAPGDPRATPLPD